MADITTNLNKRPYFDDYAENKEFYRILFKPGTAVQARELTQLQTILQKQVNRFGSHIFKNGSVVDGVNPDFVQSAHVVRVKNSFSNNSQVDIDAILNYSNNLTVESQTTDLIGRLVYAEDGSEAAKPNTKRLYVTYEGNDTSQTRTSSGTLSLTNGSNTVTGTSTSFTSYSVNDVITIFETADQGKVSFNATVASIANNTSMDLSRALTFANTSITSNNFIVSTEIDAFGQIGSDASPEILDLTTVTVLNAQSNTVNTAVSTNTFGLDFSVANTALLEVTVNDELQVLNQDYTAATSSVTFLVDLDQGDVIDIIEKERTVAFSGLRIFSDSVSSTVGSEPAMLARNDEGILYHKGQFLNIDAGFAVISDNLIGANNAKVVVRSDESIVTYKADQSLLDNAAGFSNESAPGADRLKIDPKLAAANVSTLANESGVATLLEFNSKGDLLFQNDDPQYAELGRQLAERTDDHAGSYTVRRFPVTTRASANNSTFKAIVGAGLGYVNGERIESLAEQEIEIDRGIETESFDDQEVVINYGNTLRVSGIVGHPHPGLQLNLFKNTSGGTAVNAFDDNTLFTAYQGVASGNNAIPTGTTKVGEAVINNVSYVSGTPGTKDCQWDISLYHINASSGQDISTARSVGFRVDSIASLGLAANATFLADIVLDADSKANIANVETLPFASYGVDNMKTYRDGANSLDNEMRARFALNVTDSMSTAGVISIDIDDDSRMTYGTKNVGALTASELANIIVSNAGSEITSTGASATASGNTVTVNSADASLVNVGDTIQITGNVTYATVTAVNGTAVSVNVDLGSSTGALKKVVQAGKVLNLTSSMVATDQVNNTIDITYPPLSVSAFDSSTTVLSIIDADATEVEELELTVDEGYYVFNTSTHANENVGPWHLAGMPNIIEMSEVYILPNPTAGVANTTVVEADLAGLKNYANGGLFQFDSGQKDHFVGDGALELTNKGLRKNILDNDSTLIVKAKCLKPNNTSGAGYVTVDSYPTTTNNVAGATEILLEEIPTYITSTGREINLRDVIDYRPRPRAFGVGSQHGTLTLALANINDASPAENFSTNSQHRFAFVHNSEFTTDYSVYKSARVNLFVMPNKRVATTRVDSFNKQAAMIADGLHIASIGIPALPSLTSEEARNLIDTDRGGKLGSTNITFRVDDLEMDIEQFNIRGYTMKDIGALHQRINNLEYYASLSNLENDVFNKQIKNNSGISRFKNGFMIEPMRSHQFGDTDNSEYAVNIDEDRAAMVPLQDAEYISEYNYEVKSGPVARYGQRIMFNHTEENIITQPRATKFRPAAPLAIRFSGTLDLFPEFDAGIDRQVSGEPIVINPDDRRPRSRNGRGRVEAASPWRITNMRNRVRGRGRVISSARTVTRTVTRTRVTENLVDRGTRLNDISLNPYIRTQTITFNARGLRPNTIHSVFFNRVNVDEHVMPAGRGARTGAVATLLTAGNAIRVNTGDTDPTDLPPARNLPMPIGRAGDAIRTDGRGNATGMFIVPAGTFLQGDRELFICDTDNLDTGEDSILSSASKMFHSNRIGAESARLVERTFNVQRSSRTVTQTETRTVQTGTRPDPIAQSFTVPENDTSDHVFISSLDLFFKSRGKNPVQVYVCEMQAGQPNTDVVLGASRKFLPAAKINVSDDASLATTFTFRMPVKLRTGKSYAFVVKPEQDDPDFDVWFSELGGIDVTDGLAVNTQPLAGIAFMGANQESWSKLQDEDIKFTLNRAVFSTGTGIVRFVPEAKDFMRFGELTYINGNSNVRVGDLVFGMDSATADPAVTSANIDNTMFGIVQSIDDVEGILVVAPSTGGWNSSAMTVFTETLRDGTTRNTNKYKVAVYRPLDARIDVDTIDNNLFVGSTFVELVDHEFSTINTSWTAEEFKDSSVSLVMNYNASNTESRAIDLPIEGQFEYVKKGLLYRSHTNDKIDVPSAPEGRSFYIDATMSNADKFTSPMIDLRRTTNTLAHYETLEKDDNAANFVTGATIDDDTNANIFSEMFVTAGESNNRYISRVVTLADGQDAEDMKLFVSAFKPPRTSIEVFVRAAQAYENINDKLFTPLKLINGDEVSDREDEDDIKELEYGFYTRAELDASDFVVPFTAVDGQYAYEFTRNFTDQSMMALNDSTGIVEYESNGATFTTYKTFQIKIVMYATPGNDSRFATESTPNPPFVYDMRAIALQV